MAREESDREDLLREATALVRRIEFRIPDHAESIVMGFRRDGAASIFFGADPVYQFNAAGELRRAFHDGNLFKAEQGRLVLLTRERTPTEVQLLRRDLDSAAAELFLAMMAAQLLAVRIAIAAGNVTVVGQVPPEVDLLPACSSELERLTASPRIASSPRAGG